MHREGRGANALLDFFMWVLGFELRASCLYDKNFTAQPSHQPHLSTFSLTPMNMRLNFQKYQGRHGTSATLRTELPQPNVLTGHVPNPLWVCSSRKKMQGMKWKYFGTLSCSGSIFCISLTLQISQCLPTPVVLNTAIQTK